MYIDKKRFQAILLLFLLIVFNFLLREVIINDNVYSTTTGLVIWSSIANIDVLFMFILWKKVNGEYFSAFTIVLICSVLFCLGQTWGWGFGINVGEKDLVHYVPLIGIKTLNDCIVYTSCGLIAFTIGGLIASNGLHSDFRIKTEETEDNQIEEVVLHKLSTILLVISIPAFLAYYGIMVVVVYRSGYLAMYETSLSSPKLIQILQMLTDWFPVALLMKYSLLSVKNSRAKVYPTIGLLIYLVVTLYTGGRSGAVTTILAFLLARHYYNKRLSKRQILPLALGGYFFIGILNAVRETRSSINRSLALGGVEFFNSFFTVIGSFLGEMGWQMSSLGWTMQHIDRYRHGTTYLAALTVWIPNLGFWAVHPASLYADMGAWIEVKIHRTGMGYTFVAESFANFGWGGIIMLLVWGLIIGRLFGKITGRNARYNWFSSMTVIILIDVLLKSFVRASFSAIIRDLVYTVFIILILEKIIKSSIYKRKEVNK
ncbi:hypothetical protein Lac2_25630 [Claveliimonas bilis]|uniref:O-antigen polysaccharide polymerase Wzy n=1 Tax=Claveliimonas bilis TaxID=3028070 RepID=UPI002930B0AF|nr:O-antigen polysaccharide polymerase Wzy [Claveliimonas bilis]BDZ84429.1 hypothetical protein Lac2_25630 [Claveliimonas bilis]